MLSELLRAALRIVPVRHRIRRAKSFWTASTPSWRMPSSRVSWKGRGSPASSRSQTSTTPCTPWRCGEECAGSLDFTHVRMLTARTLTPPEGITTVGDAWTMIKNWFRVFTLDFKIGCGGAPLSRGCSSSHDTVDGDSDSNGNGDIKPSLGLSHPRYSQRAAPKYPASPCVPPTSRCAGSPKQPQHSLPVHSHQRMEGDFQVRYCRRCCCCLLLMLGRTTGRPKPHKGVSRNHVCLEHYERDSIARCGVASCVFL